MARTLRGRREAQQATLYVAGGIAAVLILLLGLAAALSNRNEPAPDREPDRGQASAGNDGGIHSPQQAYVSQLDSSIQQAQADPEPHWAYAQAYAQRAIIYGQNQDFTMANWAWEQAYSEYIDLAKAFGSASAAGQEGDARRHEALNNAQWSLYQEAVAQEYEAKATEAESDFRGAAFAYRYAASFPDGYLLGEEWISHVLGERHFDNPQYPNVEPDARQGETRCSAIADQLQASKLPRW